MTIRFYPAGATVPSCACATSSCSTKRSCTSRTARTAPAHGGCWTSTSAGSVSSSASPPSSCRGASTTSSARRAFRAGRVSRHCRRRARRRRERDHCDEHGRAFGRSRPGGRGAHQRPGDGAIELTWAATGARVVRASPDSLGEHVSEATRVFSISHVVSPTAAILPVAELCARAREAGLLSVVDGAHAPGHVPVDLAAIGADAYAGNCHKSGLPLCANEKAGVSRSGGRTARRYLLGDSGCAGWFPGAP